MSRSGYSYDLDNWAHIKWRGQVRSAIMGRRGQKFLRELLAALDAMPDKRLVANVLEFDGYGEFVYYDHYGISGEPLIVGGDYLTDADGNRLQIGDVCALGQLAKMQGKDVSEVDPHEPEQVAEAFDIAHQLAAEVVYVNDEGGPHVGETPEQRWVRVRKWVAEQIWEIEVIP